jgi:hypothetical protein
MGRKTVTTRRDISKATNPDQRASLAAMRRAAKLAREVAIQTNTEIVVVRDGKTVTISVEELREEAEAERNGHGL